MKKTQTLKNDSIEADRRHRNNQKHFLRSCKISHKQRNRETVMPCFALKFFWSKLQLRRKHCQARGERVCTEVAFLLLTQQPRVQFSFPFAELYRRCWLEESGQRLENIDRTHLLLASGKLVLHKSIVRLVSRCWVWVRFLICSWPSPRVSELGEPL